MNPRRLFNTLEAGRVRRYHAAPTVATQTLAHHQWNAAMLLYYVADSPSPELIFEALLHDTGEYVTGDIPFTLKRDNPHLKAELHGMEADAREQQMLNKAGALSDCEMALLKVADTLDGLLWTFKHEERGGPVHARWVDAYHLARHKFAQALSKQEWIRADMVFDSCCRKEGST